VNVIYQLIDDRTEQNVEWGKCEWSELFNQHLSVCDTHTHARTGCE